MREKTDNPITPAEALESLRPVDFQPGESGDERDFGRAELLQSVLPITRLDQVAESKLVRQVVKNALGRIPDIAE
jgi:hypothetical protein